MVPDLVVPLGKTTFVAHQTSPRGGVLRVTLAGDLVRLADRAVTYFPES